MKAAAYRSRNNNESAVLRLIALLTIPAEGIFLNAENYRISFALFIPLAYTLSSHLRTLFSQLSRTLPSLGSRTLLLQIPHRYIADGVHRR